MQNYKFLFTFDVCRTFLFKLINIFYEIKIWAFSKRLILLGYFHQKSYLFHYKANLVSFLKNGPTLAYVYFCTFQTEISQKKL